MQISPAFRTLSVKVPHSLAARVDGYTQSNNKTVSGFIKDAVLAALGDYQCDTPIPMEVSKSEVDALIAKVGKVLAATSAMPPTKKVTTLELLLTLLSNAKPHFDLVAASSAVYAGSYKSLQMQVRNAHRAAQTRALTHVEVPVVHEVRKLKDILRDSKLPDIEIPASLYNVEASELIAAGYDPSLSMDTTGVSKDMETAILRDITWLRGAVSGVNDGWLPDRRCEAGEAYLTMMIERNKALISESHPKASPERLAYYEKLAEHVATLPTP